MLSNCPYKLKFFYENETDTTEKVEIFSAFCLSTPYNTFNNSYRKLVYVIVHTLMIFFTYRSGFRNTCSNIFKWEECSF